MIAFFENAFFWARAQSEAIVKFDRIWVISLFCLAMRAADLMILRVVCFYSGTFSKLWTVSLVGWTVFCWSRAFFTSLKFQSQTRFLTEQFSSSTPGFLILLTRLAALALNFGFQAVTAVFETQVSAPMDLSSLSGWLIFIHSHHEPQVSAEMQAFVDITDDASARHLLPLYGWLCLVAYGQCRRS